MKRNTRLIENLLLTLLLLGGMIAVYLYAGRQEFVLSSAKSSSASVHTDLPSQPQQTAGTPEMSADGRLRDAVLAVFVDAGYTLAAQQEDGFVLQSSTGDKIAELIPSGQGERINGLTLRVPLPSKPEEKKNPTLAEQARMKRYGKDMKGLSDCLPKLLRTALKAMDPYGEVPTTASLYWESLLLDALHGDHSASDAGEVLRFRVYETAASDTSMLCLMLQMK